MAVRALAAGARDESRRAILACRPGSARYRCSLPEQRVRENTFYLGVDRGGAFNDHANLQQFMARTTLSIADAVFEPRGVAADASSPAPAADPAQSSEEEGEDGQAS